MKHLLIITALLLTGCTTYNANEVKTMHNLKLVTCAQDTERGPLFKEYGLETAKNCAAEVDARLANGKITTEQYDQYLMHVDTRNSMQAQQLGETMQHNQRMRANSAY